MKLENLKLWYSGLSERFYAGFLRESKNATYATHSLDVTDAVISAMINRWNGFRQEVVSSNGKRYEISVKEIHPDQDEKDATIEHMEEVSAEVAAWPEEKRLVLGKLAEGFEQELCRVSTAEAQMANDSDLAGEVEKEGGE